MADDNKSQNEKAEVKEKKAEVKEKKTADVQISDKLSKIIDQIAGLTVLELSELVKALEDKFGVQAVAAAPVGAAGGAASAGAEAPVEEKTEFTVVLSETGANKIGVIKALREIKPELGLKEAKDITEAAPAEILANVKKDQAEEAKKKLEEAGAKVELK